MEIAGGEEILSWAIQSTTEDHRGGTCSGTSSVVMHGCSTDCKLFGVQNLLKTKELPGNCGHYPDALAGTMRLLILQCQSSATTAQASSCWSSR